MRNLEYDRCIRKFEDEPREDFDERDLRTNVLDDYAKKLNFSGTH